MEVSTRCNAASGLGASDHSYQGQNVETQRLQTLVSLSQLPGTERGNSTITDACESKPYWKFEPVAWRRIAEIYKSLRTKCRAGTWWRHDNGIMKTESTFPATHISRPPCHSSHATHRWWSLVRYRSSVASCLAAGKRSSTLILEGAGVRWQHGNVCLVFFEGAAFGSITNLILDSFKSCSSVPGHCYWINKITYRKLLAKFLALCLSNCFIAVKLHWLP